MNKSTKKLLFKKKLNPRKAISKIKLRLLYHDPNQARRAGQF